MNSRLRARCAAAAMAVLASMATLPGTVHAEDHPSKQGARRNTSLLADRLSSMSATAAQVYRVAGPDRIQTAIAASGRWDDAGTPDGALAQAVVLSRHDQYADALGGSALAGAAGGPLLLTRTAYLDSSVKAEIDRIMGGTGPVYLLGDTSALSAQVASSLSHAGYTVKRLGGPDRFDTSLKVAEEVGRLAPGGKPQFVFATTGLNFPDGLAAGATAAGWWSAVVLTRDSTLTAPVKAYLDAMKAAGVPEFAVGGPAANVNRAWSWEYNGADRYETAALLATDAWGSTEPNDDPSAIGLATGLNWPDALAGGAFMAGWGPLVLSTTTTLPQSTSAAIDALVHSGDPSPVTHGFVFGEDDVVNLKVEAAFTARLG